MGSLVRVLLQFSDDPDSEKSLNTGDNWRNYKAYKHVPVFWGRLVSVKKDDCLQQNEECYGKRAVSRNGTGMISINVDKQSYGELKWYAEGHAN